MIKFTLLKSFFDAWDNLLWLVIANITLLILVVGFFWVLAVLPFLGWMYYLCFILGIFIIGFFTGGIMMMGAEAVQYKKPGIRTFFSAYALYWKEILIFSLVLIVLERLIFLVIPYYFLQGSLISLVIGTLLAWMTIILSFCTLFFLPVSFQLNRKIKKSIRICLTLVFDNTAFCLVLGLFVVILAAMSSLTVTILPGLFGICILVNSAVKIRLLKYDYLEKNKDTVKVPWLTVLEDEVKLVGKRTIRNMIFPWKE
jgi:hypothetical protein